MSTALELKLSGDPPPGQVAQLTRQLAQDLSRVGVPANLAAHDAGPSTRGVITDVATLLLGEIGSTVVGPFIETLKAWLIRDQRLKLIITRPDKARIEIDAKNIGTEALKTFLSTATSTLC